MPFSAHEKKLLRDIQNEEKLCIQKYHKAADQAYDPNLKQLLSDIEGHEQSHYDTVTAMLKTGQTPPQKQQKQGQQATPQTQKSGVTGAKKQSDTYLMSDLLATEKYVSGVYNTAVFEFSAEDARQRLSTIMQQEQHHGKLLADYMQANGMYC